MRTRLLALALVGCAAPPCDRGTCLPLCATRGVTDPLPDAPELRVLAAAEVARLRGELDALRAGARIAVDRCDADGCMPAAAGPVPPGPSRLRLRFELPARAPTTGWRATIRERCRIVRDPADPLRNEEERREEHADLAGASGSVDLLEVRSPAADGERTCRWRATVEGPVGATTVIEDEYVVAFEVSGPAAPR